MKSVYPEENRQRAYVIRAGQDLFDEYYVTRRWGRIGTRGRSLTKYFDTEVLAEAEVSEIIKRRLRHRYVTVLKDLLSQGHVFISYSSEDLDYVNRLANELKKKGIKIFYDNHIDYGQRWPGVITKQLSTCSAFIVIMTPKAQKSTWVKGELLQAIEWKKPMFPLLLKGKGAWLPVKAYQYVDVRNLQLPPSKFYKQIIKAIKSGVQH